MLKVKTGDTGKLGLLYERYKKRLFGFFYQMNHDVKVSEDLVQNVFVRVLKYKHSYREDSQFITWLFCIARNVNFDHYKKYKKDYHTVELQNIHEKKSENHEPDEQLIANENTILLKRAMNRLPTKKQEILLLSKFQELKYKEIAVILGCTEVAARTKAHRALSELKEIFIGLRN